MNKFLKKLIIEIFVLRYSKIQYEICTFDKSNKKFKTYNLEKLLNPIYKAFPSVNKKEILKKFINKFFAVLALNEEMYGIDKSISIVENNNHKELTVTKLNAMPGYRYIYYDKEINTFFGINNIPEEVLIKKVLDKEFNLVLSRYKTSPEKRSYDVFHIDKMIYDIKFKYTLINIDEYEDLIISKVDELQDSISSKYIVFEKFNNTSKYTFIGHRKSIL